MEQQIENPVDKFRAELAKNHEEAKASLKKEEEAVDAKEEKEEAPQVEAKSEEAPQVPEPEEEIVIRGKTFKSQSEAIAYAEQIAHEKELMEAHNLGIQEALRAVKAPLAPEPPPQEDKFEEEFYTDPKKALVKIKEQTKAEMKAELDRERQRESLWSQFLTQNPDIAREDAEMILQRNLNTIGQMTDLEAAAKALATKTRAYYQSIIDRSKPRTELPNKSGQVVSTGSQASGSSVTPKKQENPVDFVSQMKNLRKR